MGRHRTVIIGLGVEYYRSLTQVHSAEDCLGDQFPLPRDTDEESVHVEIVNREGEIIPYEMSRPLSRSVVLRTERLSQLLNPGDMKEWSFKGTTLYVTDASAIDSAILGGARRGFTLYEPTKT
jgi:hypothetical protein